MTQRRIRKRYNQLVAHMILVFLALTRVNYPLPGASGGSIKYPHRQLSSLGRQQDFVLPSINSDGKTTSDISIATVIDSKSSNSIAGGDKKPITSGAASDGGEVLVPKSFPLSAHEPTCEELRAMWIFSKRQSRAAEISNEIPTYRDPFEYNTWSTYYPSMRSIGGLRMATRYVDRARSPVFGRIVSREPLLTPQYSLGDLQRPLSPPMPVSVAYSKNEKSTQFDAAPRRQMQYRFSGDRATGVGRSGAEPSKTNSVAVQGSFQKLKELIWTERAKDLMEQRRAEELAARAAVIKEIANGQLPTQKTHHHSSARHTSGRLISGLTGGPASSVKGKVHKSPILTSNPASDRAVRLLLPHMMATNYGTDYTPERGVGSGVTKTYPMGTSYFRERNRSLLKDLPVNSRHFRRTQRRINHKSSLEADYSMMQDHFVQQLNYKILQTYLSNMLSQHLQAAPEEAAYFQIYPIFSSEELSEDSKKVLQRYKDRLDKQELKNSDMITEPIYNVPEANMDLLAQHILKEEKEETF